jgi:hypothetical protein
MHTYRFCTYDVWGNARDGYEVNDTYRTSMTVTLPSDATDAEVIKGINAAKILSKRATPKNIRIDGDEDTIYIERAKDGYPIGVLHRE